MENLNNSNIDSCVIVTNKTEEFRDCIELLYESKKRSGGDEIENIIYDKFLNQFIIMYKNNSCIESVLNFGDVEFSNQIFQAFKIDQTKIILENFDVSLNFDVLNLYTTYLLDNNKDIDFRPEIVRPGCLLISCNNKIDLDLFIKRHSKHKNLQNRLISFHFLPLFDKEPKNKQDFSIFLNLSQKSILNDANLRNNSNENLSMIFSDNLRDIFYKNEIKTLKKKLESYENLNSNFYQKNKLFERKVKLEDKEKYDRTMNCKRDGLVENRNNESHENDFEFNQNPKLLKFSRLNSLTPEFQSKNPKDNLSAFVGSDNNSSKLNPIETNPRKIQKSSIKLSYQPCTFSPNLKIKSTQNSSLISFFPITKYQEPKFSNADIDTGESFDINKSLNLNLKCSICLEDFVSNENVKTLSCFHIFHVDCIDAWLVQKCTCPTCKLDLKNYINN